MNNTYKVLLFYKYTQIDAPKKFRQEQWDLCESLGIKGRILIATEGINGTVAGLTESIDSYMQHMEADQRFADMEWKISWADEQIFPKNKVTVRDEIVTLGVKKTGTDVNIENKAHYIEPEELLALYENNTDFVILDARNIYEAAVGKFKDALIPPIDNFREFPQFVEDSLADYKDKDVVTYCTGGIRCEKASAYLREKGFKKVRQLHGGIHTYHEKTGGKHFEGELFVFDKRLHVPVNDVNPTTISECSYCSTKISRYIDCTEHSCGSLFICCPDCENQHTGACSAECEEKLSNGL